MRITRKSILWSLASALAIFSAAELIARYYLGLGTPTLSIAHPGIEYLYKPNQDLYRFGHHFITNQYGMRSAPFAKEKIAGEFRVMVFGDSVITGGSQTDHADLSTTVLAEQLGNVAGKKVIVGNIAANSWGPGNWLAYAREYGFFGADITVLVISSHDYIDNPTFAPLNPDTHPTHNPLTAVGEGLGRYLPRFLPHFNAGKAAPNPAADDAAQLEKAAQRGLGDLRAFLILAQKNSSHVLVLQHWEKAEIERGSADPGNLRIQAVCEELGISPVSLAPYYRRSVDSGADPYLDNIHTNPLGQKLIAGAILEHIPGAWRH